MAFGIKNGVRRRLAVDMGLLILALCLVFLGIYSYRDAQARKTISEAYVSRGADRVLKEYRDNFEGPIKSELNRIREWGASGLLAEKDPMVLNRIFKPMVRENKLINELNLSDSKGFRYSLRRKSDGWITTIMRTDTLEGATRAILTNDQGELLSDRIIQAGYIDLGSNIPQGKLHEEDADKISWSTLYVNAELGEEAISASVEWQSKKSGRRVMSLEILLNDLFDKIEELSAMGPGTVLLLNDAGQVLLPTHLQASDSSWSSVLVSAAELPEGSLRVALMDFTERKDRAVAASIKAGKDTYWTAFRSVAPGESPVWMGFVVTENELLGLIRSERIDLIYIGIVILLLAVVLGLFIVRKYRFQLKDLPGRTLNASSTESELRELIDLDERATLEFKSTMRKNLRSGKKDKAIEIAFLKGIVGFMNTDGGTLLIGVNDDGEIVGTEEDEFENNDKFRLHFKNLFRQHIGMEFGKYVEFFLKEIEGKTIAVVVCQRSKEAVFLKHEGKELFYIRNGPSSEELAPSKVLSRMKGRG